MSRFFDLVSKPAREIEDHPSAPQPALGTPSRLLRLDSNENPFGPSPRAVETMQSCLASANSYPDDDCTELRNKLATYHAVAPEQVFVAAGSTALIGLLCQTMLGPGLNAVTSQRSFIVYSMAVHVAGAQLIEVPMRGDSFDLDAMLQAIQENTRLVFLANPNNPTGTMLEAADVYKFVAAVPGHVVVVLDEAYYEFAEHFASLRGVEYTRSLEYVRAGAGVIVLRTFSKAHGLAGLRVGYGLGPAELLAYCAHMRSQFAVSSLALAAAEAALDDQNHIGGVVSSNAVQAALLQEGLAQLGYRVVPTAANFVYCDVGEEAAGWAERLQKEGVSVRPLAAWGAPHCIRVTVGTAEQNQFFLSAARKASGPPPRTIVI